MSLQTLRVAALEKVKDRIVPAVLERLAERHKKGWRECPCSWCQTKREATSVIANPAPIQSGTTGWLSQVGEKDCLREILRGKYRQRLSEEFEK